MNRIIKFRIWAENDEYPSGHMYCPEDNPNFALNLHGDVLNVKHNENGFDSAIWARIGNNGVVLMQFTGLLDKNGKDIYEGDTIRITDTFHTYLMPVIWHRDAWMLKDDGTYGTLSEWNQSSEVIGNIYENPGLLA